MRKNCLRKKTSFSPWIYVYLFVAAVKISNITCLMSNFYNRQGKCGKDIMSLIPVILLENEIIIS